MKLQGLKKRFSISQKGYTERSQNALGGNKWYIPHHGVYHPAKSGKIKVIFECNAEYLGYTLNKQLMPGPDLTNQIVGVLISFREEQVAFMGDIEAMFTKSGFLNVNEAFYDSCGGKATTSTINLPITRCVFMYLEVHHHQVVAIMDSKELQLTMKSSLVQKLPRQKLSTPDPQSAISLIKAVTKMCKAGGSKLGKFISNDTVVLKSLQEDQRRVSKMLT